MDRPASLSAEELTRRFFGGTVRRDSGGPRHSPRDLTASARYIAQEAKKRLGQLASLETRSMPGESGLFDLIRAVEKDEGEALSDRERTAVAAAIASSFDDYDLLSTLLDNPEVNDVIVRSYDDISIQSHRMNVQTGLRFADQDTYRSFVENLLKRAGKACTMATPVVDAAIDSRVRACVTHESFSPSGHGPMLTLRVARHRSISLDSLVHLELAPFAVLDYLAAVVTSGAGTILVAGEVGTGKTTLIKALALKVPEQEAILTIEDTHEIILERKFVRTLLTRDPNTEGCGKISPAMAIRTGMRMAMNRLILGEMRDAEAAEAFIDVCASGHAGMSTIHARSARDALGRLELFLSRAQGNVSSDTIRRQVANAVSVVVFLGVDKHSFKRRVVEVAEVGAFSDGAVQFSPIFRFQNREGVPEWRREGGLTTFCEILRTSGYLLADPGTVLTFEDRK